MMKFTKLALVLLFVSTSLIAQPATKTELIAEIMKAYGVEQTLDSTRIDMIKQADTAIKGALEQIKTSRPQLSEAGWAKIIAAAEKYLTAATGGWNGADLVREYSKVYEERYSLDELTALAAYLKTEGAQKSIATEKIATQAMTEYIMTHTASAMQTALKVFISELQAAMSEEVTPISEATPPPTSILTGTAHES